MRKASEESKRQVTLEDLLHLKRAERPPAEFWSRFEQELRAKQLAAIVSKRPWWRTLPAVFTGTRRYQLPLGATAILALTFLSVREYRLPSASIMAPAPAGVGPIVSKAPEMALIAQERASVVTVASSALSKSEEVSYSATLGATRESAPVAATEMQRADVDSASSLSRMVPWLGTAQQMDSRDLSPSAQSIAANLTAAEESHPELTRRFHGSSGGFEKRGLPATRRPAAVDPLAQMRSPSETRRERLLASALPVAARASGPSGERIAGRISDERLIEQEISRFGARGDRFLVKF